MTVTDLRAPSLGSPPGGSRLSRIRASLTPSEWRRFGGMVGFVLALHIVGFALLVLALSHHYHISRTAQFGLGTGGLAYLLGMRHAFDADHIAAIDNT
ncbi:MAG: HoxN/HupN/NixA family nickel/cobalt transporter, partial [Acidimicrobiales bacterium]